MTHTIRVGALAGLMVITPAGCGGIGSMLGTAKPAPVTAARLEPGGRGLFVVRPPAGATGCTIGVAHSPEIECDSQYLVTCDATAPENEPFCHVTEETSPARESIYPARAP